MFYDILDLFTELHGGHLFKKHMNQTYEEDFFWSSIFIVKEKLPWERYVPMKNSKKNVKNSSHRKYRIHYHSMNILQNLDHKNICSCEYFLQCFDCNHQTSNDYYQHITSGRPFLKHVSKKCTAMEDCVDYRRSTSNEQ